MYTNLYIYRYINILQIYIIYHIYLLHIYMGIYQCKKNGHLSVQEKRAFISAIKTGIYQCKKNGYLSVQEKRDYVCMRLRVYETTCV